MMRMLSGKKLKDKAPVFSLLKENEWLSVNQMLVESIMKETWRVLNVIEAPQLFGMRSVKTVGPSDLNIKTRFRSRNNLHVGFPVQNFAYHGQQLWNMAPEEIVSTKSKAVAKKTIREFSITFPI